MGGDAPGGAGSLEEPKEKINEIICLCTVNSFDDVFLLL